ncbi:Os03g0294032 [Oryza sativa Japonica Group]|uniref:Os03g0294032 protein n=1 Tax=Oryza sativa subsp. japonica TaxID=39947 RepID=A0A0P0VX15_ORYSJ|nr:hypothetical protein EE612_016817 [Oryza sativa]BAS83696.1 Os03g0294032 [Oryza sativa Japonica Group]
MAVRGTHHFSICISIRSSTTDSPRCFARQDGVNTHTAWHVFLVNKSFTKHNYIGEGNLIPATEKVSFTPAKHRCVAVTGMATRVEMWALCASASGFSSEVWAVLDLKIVLAWLLVSETQNIRDFFTKGDTLVLHQLAVHLSARANCQCGGSDHI